MGSSLCAQRLAGLFTGGRLPRMVRVTLVPGTRVPLSILIFALITARVGAGSHAEPTVAPTSGGDPMAARVAMSPNPTIDDKSREAMMPLDADVPALRQRIARHGAVPVIVTLRLPARIGAVEGSADSDDGSRTSAITAVQDQVVDRLLTKTGQSRTDLQLKRFSVAPAFAATITEAGLDALLSDDRVSQIQLDAVSAPIAPGGDKGRTGGPTAD